MLYARTFQKLPEGSGTFRNLLSLCCMQEHSRSFRKVPEPSGTFLVGAPGSCIYGMSIWIWAGVVLSCIIFIAFRNVTTFPQRRFRKVPEPSGRFGNVHCIPHIHSMLFYCILTYPQRMPTLHIFHMNTHFVVHPMNVPEPSGRFWSCIPQIPHKNLYFVTMTLFLTYIFLCRPVNWTRLVLLLSLRS